MGVKEKQKKGLEIPINSPEIQEFIARSQLIVNQHYSKSNKVPPKLHVELRGTLLKILIHFNTKIEKWGFIALAPLKGKPAWGAIKPGDVLTSSDCRPFGNIFDENKGMKHIHWYGPRR